MSELIHALLADLVFCEAVAVVPRLDGLDDRRRITTCEHARPLEVGEHLLDLRRRESERGFRACQLSYNPGTFSVNGPWMRMFQNAYEFATRG